MQYTFPKITNIEQVYAAIEGKSEFVTKYDEDNGWIIFNYNVNFESTFPPVVDDNSKIVRECRGLTFHKDGTIAARKWHKFFNIGEKTETSVDNIDWNENHQIFEKEDGSMITPIFSKPKNKIIWCTKMGETTISDYVNDFVLKNTNYIDMAKWAINNSITPLFEFCSRKNRVVLDHPTERLILLSARNNITGQYLDFK